MPLDMADLVFTNGLGEEEGAPIRYATDNAIGGEDEGTGGTCDSGGVWRSDYSVEGDSTICKMKKVFR